MKKTLALILAFAMVFSTITVAFAEEPAAVSAEATALGTIGMLEGDGDGVTAEYTAKELNRLTAAIMILKLKGLYEDALKYDGVNNFVDAEELKWAEGKNILAYVKDNPVGFGGNEKGEFNPYDTLSEQMLYKVLLENLGYKQTTTETTDGDFAWDETLEFAEKLGLKPAKAEKFTVDGLAKAVVAALKTNMKDGKAWIEVLVESEKVNKEKAVAADLMADAPATTDAKLSAVKAISNNKLEVKFDAEVEKAFAENTENYAVVVKDTTTALEVVAAVQESAKVVALETAAQTAGKSYTLTVGDVKVNFAGLAKDIAAPKLDKVVCIDTNTVEVTFDKVMDKATTEDFANYTLNNNATVKSASLDSGRKVVTLTTEGVANSKLYTLKVAGVKSSDAVEIKAASKSFTGKTDTTAAKINYITIVNNERIRVYFTDAHGVDKTSAETIDNYSITEGSNALEILSIKAVDEDEDDYGYYEMVEIVTSPQTAGKIYKLKINNLVDGSVSANVITKELSKTFTGRAADKTAPTVSTAPVATTNTTVEVVFSDSNALSVDSATDLNNYEMNNDITISKAEIKDTDDLYAVDGKTVILTVSEMEKGKTYSLTIKAVADEFGNEIKPVSGTTYRKYSFAGKGEDLVPPTVSKVVAVDNKTVKVTFDEKVIKATAQDPTNYVINGDLGAALKASLSSTDGKTVTLTTPEQVANKAYTITINGVQDLSGNELANVKVGFVSQRTSNDTEAPEVLYIEALYKDEIRVHFNEAVVPTAANLVANTVTFNMVGNLLDDETTMVLKPAVGATMTSVEYVVSAINGIKDKSGNAYVEPTDAHKFWGTAEDNDKPEVITWEQTEPTKIRVSFSEPVLLIAPFDASAITKDSTDSTVYTWTATVDPDGDETNDAYSIVEFTANTVLKADKDFSFDFTKLVEDYVGTRAKDSDDTSTDTLKKTVIRSYINDETKPEIVNVEAVNKNKVLVTFSEDLKSVGSYRITYDKDGSTLTLSQTAAPAFESSTVKDKVVLEVADMDADYTYTLKPIAGAVDLSNNTLDIKDIAFDFVGTNVSPVAAYIKGVAVVNASEIEVTKSNSISVVTSVYELDADGAAVGNNLKGTDVAVSSTKSSVATLMPLLKGVKYQITVDSLTYNFEGIVENSAIDAVYDTVSTKTVITYSGIDVDKHTVTVEGTTADAGATTFETAAGAHAAGDVIYVFVTRKLPNDGVVLYGAKVTVR